MSYLKNLFKGSGSFTQSKSNEFDAIIVDEAQRKKKKSGLFSNLGENQVKEIINASKFSVFFIDKHQKISIKDYGSIDVIREFGEYFDAEVEYIKL